MAEDDPTLPTVCIVVGMAGSGKTTLLQRINAHMHEKQRAGYMINLDPAVANVPWGANIDIRDTVKYKEVMKQYGLGPNGGILTSLNLFATRFDQVLTYLEGKEGLDNVFIDTPGQIEVFTWSASGAIITETLSVSFPTVLLYVVDTPRTLSPSTFMSNMLYACSILYKTKLPFVLAFNKADIEETDKPIRWMSDFEAFQEELLSYDSISSDLVRSMSLVLEEFYNHLTAVGVSAVTGQGMDDLFDALSNARAEYWSDFRPALDAKIAARDAAQAREKLEQLARLKSDIEESRGMDVKSPPPPSPAAASSAAAAASGPAAPSSPSAAQDANEDDMELPG